MADPAQRPRSRRRRWPIALVVLLVLAAVGAALLHHYSRPERLTAFLVAQTRALLGADLRLGGTAGFGFSPTLHLVLPSPTLSAEGRPLLRAVALDASVPWHTLWSDRIDIERIVLVQPVVDLDAVTAWLNARPAGDSAPDVRFALDLRDGSVVSAGKTLAAGLDVQLANAGDLADWLHRWWAVGGKPDTLPPLTGSASARTIEIGDTRIEGLRIDIDAAGTAPQEH